MILEFNDEEERIRKLFAGPVNLGWFSKRKRYRSEFMSGLMSRSHSSRSLGELINKICPPKETVGFPEILPISNARKKLIRE